MSAPQTPLSPAPTGKPRSRWRRAAWLGLACALVAGASGLAFYAVEAAGARRRLDAFAAALDAADPGWRLVEIEAARATMLEDRNSARLCRGLAERLGDGWPDAAFESRMVGLARGRRLDEGRRNALAAEMKRLEGVRAAARPLADMPRGRFEIAFAANPIATALPGRQETRRVANLLRYEALHLADAGEVTAALRAGRACVCAGRAIGDEPFLISQMIRVSVLATALGSVEQSLALGEAADAELAALGTLLEEEARENTLLVSLRGERAILFELLSGLVSGAITPEGLNRDLGGKRSWGDAAAYPGWRNRRQPVLVMEKLTGAVENARKPPHEQAAGEAALERDLREVRASAALMALLLPPLGKVGEGCRRKAAQVAAMRGLLAVERFRIQRGRWPAKLGDVVPDFLDRLPADPDDGKPIRMARLGDGVAVYGVGPDGRDDGGKLDRERPGAPGSDVGYRLWDVAERRRPATPAVKGPDKKPRARVGGRRG